MSGYENYHDTVHWNMADITSRIIAESGIPSDRFHLGKIILQSLKDYPDDVAQIEGSSGESETNNSLLRRSIQCAESLKKLGLQQGDVIVLMAPNHLELVVPFYAALYLGIIVAPIDRYLGINELIDSFAVTEPKMVFCESEKVEDVSNALKKVEFKTKVITFDRGGGDMNFIELLELGDPKKVAEFRPSNLDPADSIAMLIPTSGTTGLPKSAAATHKNFAIMGPYIWSRTVEVPQFKSTMVVAPFQWVSAILNYICAPYMRFTRIQSRQTMTRKHTYELINRYKPSFIIISPTMMMTLMKPEDRGNCDFSCFKRIALGGSAVYSNLIEELAKVAPKTEVTNTYGLSELTNISFSHGFSSPPDSCGKPIGCLQYRLVDVDTGSDINEPNKNGELWLKGPGLFKGYYKNPEATKDTFAEGGWFKTGDLFYRDASWNFYFVERLKLLLKYMNHQISPVELERVIRRVRGVLDAAVTGVPHARGELPVACVVRAAPHTLTAQHIKDAVRESLSDTKQLRGGVIFLEQLPLTASTKVDRRKIKELALTMKRE